MEFKFDCGGRHKYFNCYCQLKKYGVGDCTMRAIAIATGEDYKVVWDSLADISKETGNLPNSRECCEIYLDRLGWKRNKPIRKAGGKRRFKLGDTPIDKNQTYIFHCSNHWTAVVKNVNLDTWDNRQMCSNSYWTKEEVI